MSRPCDMTALSLHVERAHAVADLLYAHLDEAAQTDTTTRLALDAVGALLGYAEDELALYQQEKLDKDAAAARTSAERVIVEARKAAERKRQVRR